MMLREILRRTAARLAAEQQAAEQQERSERATMLIHIVLFRMRPEVSDAEVEACMAGLQGLAQVIPEIRSFEVRRDEVAGERSTTFGIFSAFDDLEALGRYQQHPAHKEAAARPIGQSEWVKTWDYTVER
jgi:hypothetical protein